MSHESSGEPGIDQELDYQEEIHSTERTLTNDDGDYSSKEVTESNFTVSAAADRVDVRCGNNGHVCQLFAPKQIQDSDTKKASSSGAEVNGHSNGQSSHKNLMVGTHSNSSRNGYSRSDELGSYDPPKLSSYDPKCSSVSERNQSGAEEMVTGYRSPYIPQNEGCSQNVPNIPVNPKRATRRQLLFTAHRWPSQWSEKSAAERAEQPKCSLCTNEIHPMNVDLEHGTSIGKLVTGYAESIRSQVGRFFLSTGRASDHDPGTDTFILSLHLRIPAGNNLQAQHLHSSLQVGTHSNSSRNGYSDSDELSSYDPPKLSSCDPNGRVLCERSLSGAEEMVTGRYSYIPQNGTHNDEIHPRNEVLSNSTSTSGGELVTGHSESSRSQVGRFCLSTSRVSDQDPHNYTNPGTDAIDLHTFLKMRVAVKMSLTFLLIRKGPLAGNCFLLLTGGLHSDHYLVFPSYYSDW
jgi:hypothetical protein